ncbi:hypothetical protein LCGC14_2473870 [marine sediment metagenome]|uniref:Uncharacterized protein n=1 Tax=marine sediment metagenome TaxID=412755 RepID=A0A0F9B9G8_9ZZZZ
MIKLRDLLLVEADVEDYIMMYVKQNVKDITSSKRNLKVLHQNVIQSLDAQDPDRKAIDKHFNIAVKYLEQAVVALTKVGVSLR